MTHRRATNGESALKDLVRYTGIIFGGSNEHAEMTTYMYMILPQKALHLHWWSSEAMKMPISTHDIFLTMDSANRSSVELRG